MKFIGLAFALSLFLSCDTMNKPLVIGHRGAMGHETENTIASIKKAMELGVDMIEIDVFNVKSGETVVFHDETLDRLTNASMERLNLILNLREQEQPIGLILL